MKVLIIEDDKRILQIVTMAFQIRWPNVKLLSSQLGEQGIAIVERESPDIVILDLNLPDINGFEVLKAIRLFSFVPVIILTVMGEMDDIIRGLELGADDYMVKPFRQLELMSRANALVRRTGKVDLPPLVVGQLSFGPSMSKLKYGNKEIELTRTEGLVMYHLMRNAGNVVTYNSLAEALYGRECPEAPEILRVHIRHLREKIEKDPSHPVMIQNKSGTGYYLQETG